MRLHVVVVVLLLALLFTGCTHEGRKATEPLLGDDGRQLGEKIRLVKVADGFAKPVFVAEVPADEGTLWVVEQRGTVRAVTDGAPGEGFVLDIRDRVEAGGFEQGLLGLAFHPDFPDDPRVFVDYIDEGGDSVLASFVAEGDDGRRLDASSEEVLLKVAQPYSNHNGGMVAFGPDGMLYWSLGDGGSGGDPQANAQDKESLLGKILRLDVSDEGYGTPDDNPFVDAPGRDEIWVYGLRNPWRFSFDRENGDLWIGDVGQSGWEEVDWLAAGAQAGKNLGWDAYEGNHRFESKDVGEVVMPVAEYALVNPHAAVTGGYRYRGDDVPALQGVYVFSDWGSGWVWGLEQTGDTWQMGRLFQSNRQVSSFGEGLDGALYLVDHGGTILRFAAA